MTFTIVHIALAFITGYLLGALGMWLVQRTRKETDETDTLEQSLQHKSTLQFEGLDDEDDKTHIQTRPNFTIAKAPEPANFDAFDQEGSLEMVEILPEAPDKEDKEDTEDFDDSSLPGIELPLANGPELNDNQNIDDALGADDTVSFIRSRDPDLDA